MKFTAVTRTIEIISALFILVFVYTATAKLLSHHSFLVTLKTAPLINFAAPFLSWTIPAIELLISILLFIPQFQKMGLYASLTLMTLFTTYVAAMLLASSHLPCSCGGMITHLSWKQHLWLNVFLTALAATGIYLYTRTKFLLQ